MHARIATSITAAALVLAVAGCTTDEPTSETVGSTTSPSVGDSDATAPQTTLPVCAAAATRQSGAGPEARAESSDGLEVWALIFNTWNLPVGDPVQIPAGLEAKIVWRVTGEGAIAFRAEGPDGVTIEPEWGPQRHISSNWDHPGGEWGTGWTFPQPGCWTFRIARGSDSAALEAEVFACPTCAGVINTEAPPAG